ncbi:MAG: hypothetical protein WCJ62_03720, partial [Flavobacterium sp.]
KDNFLDKNLGKPEFLTNFLLELTKDKIMSGNNKIEIKDFICDNNSVHINPKFQKDFNYSDGQAGEDYVLNTLRSAKDLSTSSPELKDKIYDWVSEYHFSQERHNLLRHIDFKSEWNILELGCCFSYYADCFILKYF